MSKLSKGTIKELVTEVLSERKAVVSEGRVSKAALQRIIKEEYAALQQEVKIEPPYKTRPASDFYSDRSPRSVTGHQVVDASGDKLVRDIRKAANQIFNKYLAKQELTKAENNLLGWSAAKTDSQIESESEEAQSLLSALSDK